MDEITIDDIEGLGDLQEYTPFHPELDEKCPIDKITSETNLRDISAGKINRSQWIRAFNSSPAKNSEAESIMGVIITHSVLAGQWVDIPSIANEDIGNIKLADGNTVELPQSQWDFQKGSQILEDIGFAKLSVDDDGKSMISPTEKMIEFIKSRI